MPGLATIDHHKYVVTDFSLPTAKMFTGSSNFSPSGEFKNGDHVDSGDDSKIAAAYGLGVRVVGAAGVGPGPPAVPPIPIKVRLHRMEVVPPAGSDRSTVRYLASTPGPSGVRSGDHSSRHTDRAIHSVKARIRRGTRD